MTPGFAGHHLPTLKCTVAKRFPGRTTFAPYRCSPLDDVVEARLLAGGLDLGDLLRERGGRVGAGDDDVALIGLKPGSRAALGCGRCWT